MPFTFSHPAAVIPLRRYGLVTSALVIGSVAPDVEAFTRLAQQDRSAHTFPGVLLITVPAALVALFVFHQFLKWPVVSLMPVPLQHRLVESCSGFRWRPWRRFLLIISSLAAGIATHLLWDSFTHDEGFIVRHWPAMSVPLFSIDGTIISSYKLAQHGSTLLGSLIVVVAVIAYLRRAPLSNSELPPRFSRTVNTAAATIGSLCAVAAALVCAYRFAWPISGLPDLQHFVRIFAVTVISVGVIELLLFSCIWWWRFAPSAAKSSSRSVRVSHGSA